MKALLLASIGLLAVAGSAMAQEVDLSTDSVGPLPVTGNVPALCSAGDVQGGDNVYALGVLIDTATGFLLDDLSSPDKIVTGSFCNSQSTITIDATPMTAQSFVGTPPDGFTDTVDYTATASGWTTNAATTNTAAATNPNATQTRSTAFAGDITVGVSTFAPSGAGLRLLADPAYQGEVTVTLAVVE